MSDVTERNKKFCQVLDICCPFFTGKEIACLRSLNHYVHHWADKENVLLQCALNCNLENYKVIDYWEYCLASRGPLSDYDSIYERLRGYGISEQILKTEGVLGDISRDINRTFPSHVLFKAAGGLGQMMLENVLRSLSEYYPQIGYCQGMNFVVGIILIACVDPHCEGFDGDAQISAKIHERALLLSQSRIEKRTFRIACALIDRLEMQGLWSSGLPLLPQFVCVLERFMGSYCADLLQYLESIGYDVGILVSKWFLTLFATTLPPTALFPLWGLLLRYGWHVAVKVAISLLLRCRPRFLAMDVVQLSTAIRDLPPLLPGGREILEDMARLEILAGDYTAAVEEYRRDRQRSQRTLRDYTPANEKNKIIAKASSVRSDIRAVRRRLEAVSEREYALKMEFQKYAGISQLIEEEEEELRGHKKELLGQIESLLYLEQNEIDPNLNEEERTKMSFVRQQDVSTICNKVKTITKEIQQKRNLNNVTQEKMQEVRKKWDSLLTEKEALKDELMGSVKIQANLLVGIECTHYL